MPDIDTLQAQPEIQSALKTLVEQKTGAAPEKPAETTAEAPKPEAPKEGRQRDESGKFVAKEKPAEAAPVEDGVEYETALRALRRDKVPQGTIDKMDRKEIIAWGQARSKTQADVDRAYEELRGLKAAKEVSAADGEQKADGLPGPGNQSASLDFKALSKPFADYDPQLGASLEKVGQALHGHFSKQLETHQGYVSSLVEVMEEMILDGIRREMGETYPDLKGDEGFQSFKVKFEQLSGSGAYREAADSPLARMRTVASDAARVLFAEKAAEAKAASKVAASREKDSQTVTPVNGRAQDRGKVLSEREQMIQKFIETHPDEFSQFPR